MDDGRFAIWSDSDGSQGTQVDKRASSTSVLPSKLWPPTRIVKGRELDLAYLTRAVTSDGDYGWTIARGLSRRALLNTLRAVEYSGEDWGVYLIAG